MYNPLSRVAVVSAAVALLVGCNSTPSPSPEGSLPSTGLPLVDAALRVGAVDRSLDSVVVVTSAARAASQAGRVTEALALLDYATVSIDELVPTRQLAARAHIAAAFQTIAAVNASTLERAADAADAVLDLAPRIEDSAVQAEALLVLLRAQLARESAAAEQIRRTIDLMYFIGDESIRVGALLEAAELLAGDDDRISPNPLVQQSIAILSLIERDVAAVRLSLGLAALSDRLGRDQDRDLLMQVFDQRIAGEVPVAPTAVAEVPAAVDYLVRLDDSVRLIALIDAVTPPAVAIHAAIAGATALADGYSLALSRARAVSDVATRARALADIAYARAKAQPGLGPDDLVAEALNALPRSTTNRELLVHIVAHFSAAYLLAGSEAGVGRLGGVLRGTDEAIAAREFLVQLLVRDRFLEQADTIYARVAEPSAALSVALAEGWARAGQIDRAVEILPLVVPRQLTARVAGVLLTPTIDRGPTPATASRLNTMQRGS